MDVARRLWCETRRPSLPIAPTFLRLTASERWRGTSLKVTPPAPNWDSHSQPGLDRLGREHDEEAQVVGFFVARAEQRVSAKTVD